MDLVCIGIPTHNLGHDNIFGTEMGEEEEEQEEEKEKRRVREKEDQRTKRKRRRSMRVTEKEDHSIEFFEESISHHKFKMIHLVAHHLKAR